jgi:hypothetical protein
MRVKFITAIYSDLYGTDLGGRINRRDHYKFSLLSLLRMNKVSFTCFTSDREIGELENFFYNQYEVSRDKLEFKVFDLYSETKNQDIFQGLKDIEGMKKSDRCYEIQYNKFYWIHSVDMDNYEYVYWIDAGLSHCGVIPDKYLDYEGMGQRGYYNSYFFDETFLHKLVEKSDEKILVIGKDNVRNYWDGTVPAEYYVNGHDSSIHIIGGLFGGRKDKFMNLCGIFDENLIRITNGTNRLWSEENIFSLLFRNHNDLFNMFYFETWWHENHKIPGIEQETYFIENKSFYMALEDIKE